MPYRSMKQQRAMWARRKLDEAFHARFKKHAALYHGSPNAALTRIKPGSWVTPDRETAELMGRYHIDTGKTWTDEDLAEPHYLGKKARFKKGREPRGKATVYLVRALEKHLDKLDNPYEHRLLRGAKVKKAEYAPGIPSKTRFVPIKEHKGTGHLTVHEHHAHRAGKHYDVRVALGDELAHSWATRRLPEPGQSVLAKQQPTHTRQYMDWQGRIEKGYGAGDVQIHRKGDVEVVESGANKVVFNQFDGKKANEFVLVRPKSDKPKDWLLMNRTTTPGKYQIPQYRESYKSEVVGPELASKPGVIQPKVDGAHAIVVLDPGKRPRVFSYRQSKRGDVLEYTHKVEGLFQNKVPTGFGKKVLRAEIYLANKKGNPLSAQRTAAVLNSGIERARQLQKGTGGLRIMPFDIHGSSAPYEKKIQTIEQMAGKMPFLSPPETARTDQQKLKLVQRINSGRHPMTREGVVHWSPSGQPTKAKLTSDTDVYVRKVFQGTGKHSDKAGGFHYSLTPDGKIVGKVGSGLTDRQRKDLWKQRGNPSGRVATIKYEKKTSKGTLFAPRFMRWHPDKDEPATR